MSGPAPSPADHEGTDEALGRPRRLGDLLSARDLGYAALIGAAALFVYLVYAGAQLRELTDATAMDQAQIARHLASGEGFTTGVIRPLSLARVQNISHHPDLVHAPLHPLWMSIFFRIGGAGFRMAGWACGAAYLLSLPLIYLLAARLFNGRVALLALALYGINYLTLRYAVSGLEVSLATLLVTGLLLALHAYLDADTPSPPWAAACGALVGLCTLVDYAYVVLAGPVILAILLRKGERRWGEALLAVALLIAVMAPWALRNARVAGSPVLTLRGADIAGGTTTYKGRSLYRRFLEEPPSGLKHLATHPRETWQKVRPLALSAYYDLVPNLGGPFIAAFFLAAAFTRFPRDGLRPLRWVHYASIALVAIAICVMNGQSRALAPFSPLAIVVGSACFLAALDGLTERVLGPRAKRRALAWGIGGFVALCWFPVAAMTFTMSPPDTATTEELGGVASAVAAREVGPIYADQPWILAWYADLDAIWIPQTVDELHKLEKAVGPIQHMLLSPVIGGAGPEEELAVWANLYRSAPRGIPFERFLAEDALGTNRDWVLFRRLPEGAVEQMAGAAGTPE